WLPKWNKNRGTGIICPPERPHARTPARPHARTPAHTPACTPLFYQLLTASLNMLLAISCRAVIAASTSPSTGFSCTSYVPDPVKFLFQRGASSVAYWKVARTVIEISFREACASPPTLNGRF